jgi:hypothetical protein
MCDINFDKILKDSAGGPDYIHGPYGLRREDVVIPSPVTLAKIVEVQKKKLAANAMEKI